MISQTFFPEKAIHPMFGLALLCGLQPQQFPLPFEQVTEVHGPKANPLSAIPTLPTSEPQSAHLEPKALPQAVLDELYRKHATFTERVMARLSEAERREINTHLQSDYRQSWITLSLAMKDTPNPFVAASYAIYGTHPDQVFPKWLAEQKAKLADEFDRWYDSNGNLKPDIHEALISAPTLPPSKGAAGAGSGTSGPAPISERKVV